jgi:hypothetical protein
MATRVQITNTTDKKIVGMWDGVEYVFKPGEPLVVDQFIAAHVFGFGAKDKSRALMNLGWLRSSDEWESALEKLGMIRCELVEMVARPIADDDLGASSQQMAPEQTGAVRPNAVSGGDDGGYLRVPPSAPLQTEDGDIA